MQETFPMTLQARGRLVVMSHVQSGHLTLRAASAQLGLSYRQTKRVWARFCQEGARGLIHRLRGRPSNHRPAADARRQRALALYRDHYRGMGPTLAAEQMARRDGLRVDHETLRGWLIRAKRWRAKPRRVGRHPRRERRACFGQLVQLDGSHHPWFGPDRPKATRMVMVDDATGKTLARFFGAETTQAAMEVFKAWAQRYGLPETVSPDRHSIDRRNDREADEAAHRTGRRPRTRFGGAMQALGVRLTHARSPQAKGRVERMNRTLQDRLVKLLALEGIRDPESANAYLESGGFLEDLNARFSVRPWSPKDLHRPCPDRETLREALSPVRETRRVDRDGSVFWRGRCLVLVGRDAQPRRRGRVRVCQGLDGRVRLRSLPDGRELSFREVLVAPKASSCRSGLSGPAPVGPGPVGSGAWRPSADHPWRKTWSEPKRTGS